MSHKKQVIDCCHQNHDDKTYQKGLQRFIFEIDEPVRHIFVNDSQIDEIESVATADEHDWLTEVSLQPRLSDCCVDDANEER